MSNIKTIIIRGYGEARDEFVAAAGITPGMLVEVTSTGKVQAHSTAGGNCQKLVALKDALQGKTISDAYVATDQVFTYFAQRGDLINMLLANGQNVAIGDFLESDGAGGLQAHTADASNAPTLSENIVGVAEEAVDMSDSSGADPNGRIKVRII